MEIDAEFMESLNEAKLKLQEIENNPNTKWYTLEEFNEEIDRWYEEYKLELERSMYDIAD